MVEFLIAAVPLLALLTSLLLGRYPGHEVTMRLAERIAGRRRGATAASNSPRPQPPTRRAAGGGLLIALSLAQRPPPLAA